MLDHHINAEIDKPFTLYLKQKDVAVNLSRQELVSLIKESIELLELSGGKPYSFAKESSGKNYAKLNL